MSRHGGATIAPDTAVASPRTGVNTYDSDGKNMNAAAAMVATHRERVSSRAAR